MRRFSKIIGIIAGVFGLLCLASFALIESGEVIVIRSTDDEGERYATRLWVVDYDGDPWIGQSDPSTVRWVARVRTHPRVDFVRGDATECRQAVFVQEPDIREAVDRLFEEKYRVPGYGSRFLKSLRGAKLEGPQAALFQLMPCADH